MGVLSSLLRTVSTRGNIPKCKELMTDELGGHDSIDGVIVTTPIPDGRVKRGWVWGLGFRVWGLGSRVYGLRFKV